jgi:hypothetical protein
VKLLMNLLVYWSNLRESHLYLLVISFGMTAL